VQSHHRWPISPVLTSPLSTPKANVRTLHFNFSLHNSYPSAYLSLRHWFLRSVDQYVSHSCVEIWGFRPYRSDRKYVCSYGALSCINTLRSSLLLFLIAALVFHLRSLLPPLRGMVGTGAKGETSSLPLGRNLTFYIYLYICFFAPPSSLSDRRRDSDGRIHKAHAMDVETSTGGGVSRAEGQWADNVFGRSPAVVDSAPQTQQQSYSQPACKCSVFLC
jgi:hypothetical protein